MAVFGTVMSGLGKGIFASSLAKLMKDKGLKVAPIKIEGYLNVDSGTLNPYRHGEVFVLDDGTECDMDLGTYERLLAQNLSRRNFCTSGQIYTEILERERKGGYLGRDVQMIPHVTGEVKRRLRQLAMEGRRTAVRSTSCSSKSVAPWATSRTDSTSRPCGNLHSRRGPARSATSRLTYILEPKTLGEQKSKAAQLGVKRLMEFGMQPNILALRSDNPVAGSAREKISMFSNVPLQRVFSMHDRDSIYTIPEAMRAEGLDREVLSLLGLHGRVDQVAEDQARNEWSAYASGITAARDTPITVGILGKYTALRGCLCIDRQGVGARRHPSLGPNQHRMDRRQRLRYHDDRLGLLRSRHACCHRARRLRRARHRRQDRSREACAGARHPLPRHLSGLPDGGAGVRPPRGRTRWATFDRDSCRTHPMY